MIHCNKNPTGLNNWAIQTNLCFFNGELKGANLLALLTKLLQIEISNV